MTLVLLYALEAEALPLLFHFLEQNTRRGAPHGKPSIAETSLSGLLNDTDFKLLHHANAFLPIADTALGIEMLSRLRQLQKAFGRILQMLSGR